MLSLYTCLNTTVSTLLNVSSYAELEAAFYFTFYFIAIKPFHNKHLLFASVGHSLFHS
jgi:hypothetical protein